MVHQADLAQYLRRDSQGLEVGVVCASVWMHVCGWWGGML
jgi:hypothetical protein